MVADVSIVGARGQITIPKSIREVAGISSKDSLLLRYESNRIYIEKLNSKKEKDSLLKEFYTKYSNLNSEVANDFSSTLSDFNE